MHRNALQWLGRSVVVAATALTGACASDGAVGPSGAAASVAAQGAGRAVELGACTTLQAPAGSRLVSHVYATGAQIYTWTGAAWRFDGPSAVLAADAGGHGTVGTHYAGPTWESNGGSKVVGAVLERCPVGAGTIPWLSLQGTPDGGPGLFRRVTFIQRVNTTGGVEPARSGSFVGEEVRVPYTAEYYFYRTD